MADTTSGAKGATKRGSRRPAAGSPPADSATDTPSGAPPTSATARAKQRPAWTCQQAREILAQTAIECQRAGLDLRAYNTTRGSVVIELLAHRIADGAIVPADVPADHKP